jgi:hypothetical protein
VQTQVTDIEWRLRNYSFRVSCRNEGARLRPTVVEIVSESSSRFNKRTIKIKRK